MKKSKLSRITPSLELKLLKAMEHRYQNKLCSVKDINMRVATELLTKSRGINMALEEIRIKPIKKRGRIL